jgi:hypothetical protein
MTNTASKKPELTVSILQCLSSALQNPVAAAGNMYNSQRPADAADPAPAAVHTQLPSHDGLLLDWMLFCDPLVTCYMYWPNCWHNLRSCRPALTLRMHLALRMPRRVQLSSCGRRPEVLQTRIARCACASGTADLPCPSVCTA